MRPDSPTASSPPDGLKRRAQRRDLVHHGLRQFILQLEDVFEFTMISLRKRMIAACTSIS